MKKTFYSNGKLLITGEYLVLDGAVSLALPTKFGQNLVVESVNNSKMIHWKSFNSDGTIWFDASISFESIIKNELFSDSEKIKNTLVKILYQAYRLNHNFIANSNGYLIETQLSFPKNWGLGTSSTLINNIAQWTMVDAFDLLQNSLGGSGYDIACAKNNTAILYQLLNNKPIVTPVYFDPIFKENIYFVYLNQKMSSQDAIFNYKQNSTINKQHITKIDTITHDILNSECIKTFETKITEHEFVLSNILNTKPIKTELFDDFSGVVKSLGAWGGDFIMVICENNPKDYFFEKGYQTILKYNEMILEQPLVP